MTNQRWDAYVATAIVTDATVPLGAPPWYVITAANPDSVVLPDGLNGAANQFLAEVLVGLGLDPVPVLGTSSDGIWQEDSLAVSGLDRQAACELGHRFGQTAIFELSPDELLVLRCPDGAVMRCRGLTYSPRFCHTG